MACTQRPEMIRAFHQVLNFFYRCGLVQTIGTVFQIACPIVLPLSLFAADQWGEGTTGEYGGGKLQEGSLFHEGWIYSMGNNEKKCIFAEFRISSAAIELFDQKSGFKCCKQIKPRNLFKPWEDLLFYQRRKKMAF